jgi:hypothetical protein
VPGCHDVSDDWDFGSKSRYGRVTAAAKQCDDCSTEPKLQNLRDANLQISSEMKSRVPPVRKLRHKLHEASARDGGQVLCS